MPEHPTPKDVASVVGPHSDPLAGTLADRLAAATLTTPGVLRLVPTLKNALRHLRARRRSSRDAVDAEHPAPGPDGVTVTIAGSSGAPAVTIDIAVTGQVPALQTALAVQAAAAAVVRADGLSSPTVRVNIVEIEPVGPVQGV